MSESLMSHIAEDYEAQLKVTNETATRIGELLDKLEDDVENGRNTTPHLFRLLRREAMSLITPQKVIDAVYAETPEEYYKIVGEEEDEE